MPDKIPECNHDWKENMCGNCAHFECVCIKCGQIRCNEKKINFFIRSEAIQQTKREIVEKLQQLPRGQTADGKHHWITARTLDDLIKSIEK